MSDTDAIHIQELELAVRIGVPEEERRKPQRLTVSLTLWPRTGFDNLEDDLLQTLNYAGVAREVKEFASHRRDKLIETMATAIAGHLLEAFPLSRVRVELRKFVLTDAAFVAAICDRRV
jgi:dihydroneopterin aldolase